MKKEVKVSFIITGALFLLFAIFTVLVMTVNVAPIGPESSKVGLSAINKAVHGALGTSDLWYNISEILGYIPLLAVPCFAVVGLVQLIKRKNLFKVDVSVLLLGAFYVLVAVFYVAFELFVVNYRPVLEEGALEASYPSSHTMLACCVMISGIFAFYSLVKNKIARIIVLASSITVSTLTVVTRLLSGVHWLTDIVGGVLLSAALVMLYASFLSLFRSKKK